MSHFMLESKAQSILPEPPPYPRLYCGCMAGQINFYIVTNQGMPPLRLDAEHPEGWARSEYKSEGDMIMGRQKDGAECPTPPSLVLNLTCNALFAVFLKVQNTALRLLQKTWSMSEEHQQN